LGCPEELERAAEVISGAGIPVSYHPSGVLLSLFTVEDSDLTFIFHAMCDEDGVEVYARIKGFEDALRRVPGDARADILMEILRAPGLASLCPRVEEGSLILTPCRDGDPYRLVGSFFADSAKIAGWLARQLEEVARGGKVEPIELVLGED